MSSGCGTERSRTAVTAAARFAYNESLYREVHERHDELDALFVEGLPNTLDLMCECRNPSCNTTVKLEPATYADVRAQPGRFVIAAGHDHPGVEIASHDGYVVIEDHELAAELGKPS
jgi:hypothetical protein